MNILESTSLWIGVLIEVKLPTVEFSLREVLLLLF